MNFDIINLNPKIEAVNYKERGKRMLEIKNLKTYFEVEKKQLKAVDGINLTVNEGEILGLVGESGCGKTMSSLSVLNIVPYPGKIIGGEIIWKGENIVNMPPKRLREIRGGEISMIFQNPLTSLNPVFTVGDQIVETLRIHKYKKEKVSKQKLYSDAVELLKIVNIPDAEKRVYDYPHQFSGGMCQRIMIAIALSSNPRLLIADEPTASLDVTIQAQILNLLMDIREKYNMSILIISHDLGVIAQSCDKIAVMYLGKIVETAESEKLFSEPLHPYTQALLESVPLPDPKTKRQKKVLKGDIPSSIDIPKGCRFHTRCPIAVEKCSQIEPEFLEKRQGHFTACNLI